MSIDFGAGKLFIKDNSTGKMTEFGLSGFQMHVFDQIKPMPVDEEFMKDYHAFQVTMAHALAIPKGLLAGGPGSGRHPGMGVLKATPVDNWKKFSSNTGSNPGGFYKNPEGITHYVKFPQKNPDQNNAEVLADRIYQHLGIPAKDSFLVMENGKMGVASPLVPNASSMSKDAHSTHSDVIKGYMADAYLANWDVFGLGWDNIVKNVSTGAAHRIDTGGALNFRAQGAEKPFPKDSVLELTSLRQPDKQGAGVWKDLGAKDERAQAKHLVDKMTNEKINEFVKAAGYEGSKADDMMVALAGRRDVIKAKYNL